MTLLICLLSVNICSAVPGRAGKTPHLRSDTIIRTASYQLLIHAADHNGISEELWARTPRGTKDEFVRYNPYVFLPVAHVPRKIKKAYKSIK